MARNEEKAQSMLNRYLREQRGGERGRRRPALASHCDDVEEATRWRAQVERDIRLRVSEIQNPALGDARTRELNDMINKLLRERRHWDRRVISLGGRASRSAPRGTSDAFSHGGYLYFGAARELPGVRELVARAEGSAVIDDDDSPPERAADLYKRLDATYYAASPHSDEIRNAELKLRGKQEAQWEAEAKEADTKWDDSFLRFVGMKPAAPVVDMSQVRLREQRKKDALELLRAADSR